MSRDIVLAALRLLCGRFDADPHDDDASCWLPPSCQEWLDKGHADLSVFALCSKGLPEAILRCCRFMALNPCSCVLVSCYKGLVACRRPHASANGWNGCELDSSVVHRGPV